MKKSPRKRRKRRGVSLKRYSIKPYLAKKTEKVVRWTKVGSKSKNSPYMGVELEMSGTDDRFEIARILTAHHFQGLHLWKEEGDLNELIISPHTLTKWKSSRIWDLLYQLDTLGIVSKDSEQSCGMHIHVNKSFFKDYPTARTNLKRLITSDRQLFGCLSNRSSESLEEFAAIPASAYSDVWDEDKSVCINFWPKNTVEFRLFNGTLYYGHFIANLLLVDALCRFVNKYSSWYKFCSPRDFLGFVKATPRYKELLEELRSRVPEIGYKDILSPDE